MVRMSLKRARKKSRTDYYIKESFTFNVKWYILNNNCCWDDLVVWIDGAGGECASRRIEMTKRRGAACGREI